MSVPFIPTKNATAGVTTAPTTSNLTTAGQMAINAYTGTMYMRKEDNTISDIVGDRLSGFRNRIINGNMAIDQRNAGASVTPTDGQYVLDRWTHNVTQASKFSVQQNAGSISGPTGFRNYLGATSLSAYSVLSGDLFSIYQPVEGFNFADFGWGTAAASSVTLSFWVRSNLTGTFGGSLKNSALNRSYPFTYTISAANTWEQKSVTIAGDTTGTWIGATNGVGVFLIFSLGAGSTFSGPAGVWAATSYSSATGATSVVAGTGNTFYITGVQLEKGLVPTPFEVRSYGTELALCQRYYQRIGLSSRGYLQGATFSNAAAFTLPVQMRATPSYSLVSGPTISSNLYSTPYDFNVITPSGGSFGVTAAATGDTYAYGYLFQTSGAEL